ncbi:MAG: hypothetical protein K0R31_2189, partial [Clostridiales bacterium]|nr:hypothetical protein [Clostridiales bacterium]
MARTTTSLKSEYTGKEKAAMLLISL